MKNSFSFVIVCFYFILQSVYGSLQNVVFFDNFKCKGENETIFVSSDEATLNNTLAVSAMSVKVFGLWRLLLRNEDTRTSLIYYGAPPNGSCYDKPGGINKTEDKPLFYSSIEMLGLSDMTSTYVAFFTEEDFQGEKYATDKQEAELTPIIGRQVRSHMQFSSTAWIGYTEHNFDGLWFCLCPNFGHGIAPHDSITFAEETYLVIASVAIDSENKCDCGGEGGGSGTKLRSQHVLVGIFVLFVLIIFEYGF